MDMQEERRRPTLGAVSLFVLNLSLLPSASKQPLAAR